MQRHQNCTTPEGAERCSFLIGALKDDRMNTVLRRLELSTAHRLTCSERSPLFNAFMLICQPFCELSAHKCSELNLYVFNFVEQRTMFHVLGNT